MSDATGLVEAIKKAAVEAVAAGDPVRVCYGTVTREKPLLISVEQKLKLKASQLVLTKNVTDYETEMTWEEEGEEVKRRVTIHNGLAAGEKVILLQTQGGQKFMVVDKL